MIKPDAMLQFAIDDGRSMTWDAGHRIYCRVSFPSILPGYHTRRARGQKAEVDKTVGEDLVVGRVEVVSNIGEVYGAERTLSANVFVDAIRTADEIVPSSAELEPIATGLIYNHDRRARVAAARDNGAGGEPVLFYLKNLSGTLDLFYWSRGSTLAIRLHATLNGAPGGRPTPEITMSTNAAAQIVLMPSLLTGGLWLPPAPLVFTRCEHSAPPQEGVRVS